MKRWLGASGFVGEKLAVHDAVVKCAADGKRVAHHGPLRFTKQAQHFAQVVNQPGEHEPIGVPGGADRLGRLQQMLQLREFDIGVRVIDQRIEIIERLEDAHLTAVEFQKLALLALDEVVRLKPVILAIELADRLAGRRIVIPIILASLRLRLGVHGIGDEFFPGLASADVILPVCNC